MGRWRRLLGWIGSVCFLVPLIPLSDPQVRTSVGISVWEQPMMPLPGMVLTPETLLTTAGLVLGALYWLAYGVLCMVAASRPGAADGQRVVTSHAGRMTRLLTRVILALAVFWGLLTAGFTLLFADDYHVLVPRSSADCAVVVSVEAGGMFGSAGIAYLKQPDSPWLADTGSGWMANDNPGADPIKDDTWSLVWRDGKAHLDIWGRSSSTEFYSGTHAIACNA
ncbi:hypothetical protein [Bifidobacterium sp.]|uniref:hypothetical protein n=1 Tax=Bifidobacterium sp. TaxID=41200 RepID=UPI0039EA0E9C